MTAFKLFPVLAALPLAFAGCTSTNPKSAFDDVGRHVNARTGQEVRWMRDDAERDEIEKVVATLLQTNLTAQSCVGIALLNNRTLQAEFESIGISQAELAPASRLKNPEFAGAWRMPTADRPGPRSARLDRGNACQFGERRSGTFATGFPTPGKGRATRIRAEENCAADGCGSRGRCDAGNAERNGVRDSGDGHGNGQNEICWRFAWHGRRRDAGSADGEDERQ